jgi:hypothetical protein
MTVATATSLASRRTSRPASVVSATVLNLLPRPPEIMASGPPAPDAAVDPMLQLRDPVTTTLLSV